MNKKKWLWTVFLFIIAFIFGLGSFNYIIDPFHQYRVKTFYPISYPSELERYINPGFAKNYDYDSIILGSSTSENFVISNVKKVLNFKKPIKLCIHGTSAYEESITLKTALKHKKIKNVLFGLDTFNLWGAPNRIKHGKETFPFYLYSDGFTRDFHYLLSLGTALNSLKVLKNLILVDKNSLLYDYNQMYVWQHLMPKNYFSKEHVMQEWEKRKSSDLVHLPQDSFIYYKKSFDSNFLTLIKKNPQTNFIIFFPPYSILTYKYEKERGVFEDRLKFKKYIVKIASKLPNLSVYDFQIAKSITHKLTNYRDLDHFHQKINLWILKQIKIGNFKITEKNIDSVINEHRKQVNEYIIK